MSRNRDLANQADEFIGVNVQPYDATLETGATADQTNAEIKTAYEANVNTNEFSDAEQNKLAKTLVQGEDSDPLLTKYTTELQERQSARDLINQLG